MLVAGTVVKRKLGKQRKHGALITKRVLSLYKTSTVADSTNVFRIHSHTSEGVSRRDSEVSPAAPAPPLQLGSKWQVLYHHVYSSVLKDTDTHIYNLFQPYNDPKATQSYSKSPYVHTLRKRDNRRCV
jgi:hypothetical protein